MTTLLVFLAGMFVGATIGLLVAAMLLAAAASEQTHRP